ncbi:MAG TPA: hypothetical protein VGU66_18935 [Candidatus Elarobacter sp.]|nr:hypothetical protein [Candidatus Elarobacter sp.]
MLSEPPAPATLQMFERSPLVVFALDVATFGFYGIYYAIRGRRLAARRLDTYQITPYTSAMWLLLPLVNIVLYIGMFNTIGRRVHASGVRTPVLLGLLAFVMVVVSALYRLPDPWWFISLTSSVALGAIHVPVALAERRDDPARTWARLHWFEIVLLVLGGLALIALSLLDPFGESVPPAAAYRVVALVWAVLIVTGIVLAWTGRALALQPPVPVLTQ